METQGRQNLVDKQRVAIKIGSSFLTYAQTGEANLMKIEKLVRVVSDPRGQGRDVVLVSFGATAAGWQILDHHGKPDTLAEKQAFAAVSQARFMMIYQELSAEHNQTVAQVLLAKDTMVSDLSGYNTQDTLNELLSLRTIPTVNENDTASTSEIPYVDGFGDDGRPPAIMVALIGADLLILLSDIDGFHTDNPRESPEARFISLMPGIMSEFLRMGKDTSGSDVDTGGISARLAAARIITDSGANMVIASGDQVDVMLNTMSDKEKGTPFLAHTDLDFDLTHYPGNEYQGKRPAGCRALEEVNV